MSTPTYSQWPMDDLLQTRDPISSLEREWLARHDAGLTCEIWDINGGADTMAGYTVLWVSDEHVFWVFNMGLEPAWHVSPFTRACTFRLFVEPDWGVSFPTIAGYVPLSTVCESGGGDLTADDRDRTALAAIQGGVWDPQCLPCLEAAVDALDELH
jgi:hypothetical protein